VKNTTILHDLKRRELPNRKHELL